jgi:phenylalanyl-tRNA synthetase alpha chain
MGGAGLIHPKVLTMAGLNPREWHGFAFGLGLDRWAMASYNITDIRTLLGGNLGYKPYHHENIV